ncbi:hypothetical protein FE257_005354 [Aspergillus nanangensis]|uniref:Uncharacterized protein n=1 Tax=Aspergillus nanangensis TaxID=2582783 RepID=A0AAD4CQF1_ASPNN|nr:hypothetical protein FE257_005354 [Aspergillus nanangensis]
MRPTLLSHMIILTFPTLPIRGAVPQGILQIEGCVKNCGECHRTAFCCRDPDVGGTGGGIL